MAIVPSVVLHTSWRGRITTIMSPSILTALGGYGVADTFRWFAFAILVVGIVLGIVGLVDYPRVTVIGAGGIERRCLLRTQRLDWAAIATVARPAPANRWRRDMTTAGTIARSSASRTPGERPAHAEQAATEGTKGGLTAEIGRRPFLLCDKVESQAEFDAIDAGLRHWAPSVPMRASRPDSSVPPTWLHKKRLGSASDGLVDLLA